MTTARVGPSISSSSTSIALILYYYLFPQPPEPPPSPTLSNLTYTIMNQTFISVTTPATTTTQLPISSTAAGPAASGPFICPWTCELTNDAGYVVYSALGSFYIPMFVMLFFYWRIYRAAVRTTRAINQGFKTTKGEPRNLVFGSLFAFVFPACVFFVCVAFL